MTEITEKKPRNKFNIAGMAGIAFGFAIISGAITEIITHNIAFSEGNALSGFGYGIIIAVFTQALKQA
jgi:hypothetical protein